jgi:hypothetical protein
MEYAFLNIKTKEIERHDMKMSEYDAFKKNNPQLERYFDEPPTFMDGDAPSVSGFDSKTDNGWKEVLAKIGEKHKGSELDKKYNGTSIKEVKTRNILEKHKKKKK